MPDFCDHCGADLYVCQKCGRILCSMEHKPSWRPDITGHKEAGNVCPDCLAGRAHKDRLLSLYEHCAEESGLTDPAAIKAYMHRHYGHG